MSEPATRLKTLWSGLESLADRFAYPLRTAHYIELVNR
jgi:hypothetical protein